jgi:outer membrane murein-binding lipoprotein Lpp
LPLALALTVGLANCTDTDQINSLNAQVTALQGEVDGLQNQLASVKRQARDDAESARACVQDLVSVATKFLPVTDFFAKDTDVTAPSPNFYTARCRTSLSRRARADVIRGVYALNARMNHVTNLRMATLVSQEMNSSG